MCLKAPNSTAQKNVVRLSDIFVWNHAVTTWKIVWLIPVFFIIFFIRVKGFRG